MLSLLQRDGQGLRSRPSQSRARSPRLDGGAGVCSRRERFRMRFVYMLMSVLPIVAFVTLAGYVIRAISVRIVWR